MTDIRQHLPLILAALRRSIAEPDAAATIRAYLREHLPASYGLGTDCPVSSQGTRSLPLNIVIYDATIPLAHTNAAAGLYDINHVLAVLSLAHAPDPEETRHLLRTIASVKALRPGHVPTASPQVRPQTSKQHAPKPTIRLKNLLPLGIVAFERLLTSQLENTEKLALALDALLKEQPEHLRPTHLLAHEQNVFYNHPALNGETFVASTINIAREPALKKPHSCYVCKQPHTHPHFFYQHLCLRCGDLNYQKRALSVDLTGRIALVTGARVKIGYATALRLLRAGAEVLATTRFPHDAARLYSQEPDFADWRERLHIYGLDFRYLSTLERFVQHLHATYPALDILINNAAQTVRYPLASYAPLLPYESRPLAALPRTQQTLLRRSHEALPPTPFVANTPMLPAAPSAHQLTPDAVPGPHGASLLAMAGEQLPFPPATPAEYSWMPGLQQQNSWTLPFNQIDLGEFLEVQTINVTTPFLLVSHLHPLLCRSPFTPRFIINVSAIEGQFASTKLGTHVHTNMAKAALNMLTHTAAAQLARDGILMHSVDPGWISQQAPRSDPQRTLQLQQLLPLDLIDAAARVCDPIFTSIRTGETPCGHFYKDYQPASW